MKFMDFTQNSLRPRPDSRKADWQWHNTNGMYTSMTMFVLEHSE